MKRMTFRFWISDEVAHEAWSMLIIGNPLFMFARRLMEVKEALKKWVKDKVNLPIILKQIKSNLDKVARRLQKDPLNEADIVKEIKLKRMLDDVCKIKGTFN